ncbi:MAG TPA: ester cyclase [Acidimicrobiales bacterium]|nr:ester cyclase [Acidimicrobiales bacterium]
MTNPDTTSVQQALERNITAINNRDLEGYLANQHPDIEFTLPGGVTLHGRDQARAYLEMQWAAFPDGQLSFGTQVLTEDTAATEVVFTGTHTGPMPTPNGPIPPTGKTVTLHSMSLLRIKNGLIASERVYADQQELIDQLGDPS